MSTTEKKLIVVTGATGTVGSSTVRALVIHHAERFRVRALVRDEAKARALLGESVELVKGDYSSGVNELAKAFEGAHGVFVVAPPNIDEILRVEATIIEAAVRANVQHLVKLSAIGAAPEGVRYARVHFAAEAILKSADVPHWTILQPNFFMQNVFASAAQIKQGTFYHAYGEGKASAVDARDIGEVAAAAFARAPESYGKTLTITGPEGLSGADISMTFSRVLGKEVTPVHITPTQLEDTLKGFHLPPRFAKAVAELAHVWANGWAGIVTDVVQKYTGHPPHTFQEFVVDNKAAFA